MARLNIVKPKAVVGKDSIVLILDESYLRQAFMLGVTTNTTGEVKPDEVSQESMLEYIARELETTESDTLFGRCLDGIADRAIQDGESFLYSEEDYEKAREAYYKSEKEEY